MQIIIETISNVDLNYRFIEMLKAIAEDKSDEAPINMMCIDAFEEVTDENLQENIDLQSIAVFLLISNEIYGMKWGSKYYFGDVDMMDNEPLFDPSEVTSIFLAFEVRADFTSEFPEWTWEFPGVAFRPVDSLFSIGFNAETICIYKTADLERGEWDSIDSYAGSTRRQVREFCMTNVGKKYFPDGPNELLDLYNWIENN